MKNKIEHFDHNFGNLEDLADEISEVLECSVTIEDVNHRLVSYSSHISATDPARISTIMGRRVPEKIIQTLWRNGVMLQLMNSEQPVRVEAIKEIGLGARLAIAIRKDNRILGYIWLMEEEKNLDQHAENQLIIAAKSARAKLLQLQLKRKKTEQGQQDFLWQLLTGHFRTDSEVKNQARQLNIQLSPLFCICIVQFASEITEKLQQPIQYLISTTFQNKVPLYIINDDQLIVFEAHTASDETEQSSALFNLFKEQMTHRFGIEPISVSYGSIYDRYTLVERSYQEALTVIQVKRKFPIELKSIWHYSELGFFRMLPVISKANRDSGYENGCLKRLHAYDTVHNSNLVQTLEIYLSNDCRLKETADRLHIHDNTLNYRLKRISEIGCIDLNNMNDKMTCYLEIKLKEFDTED